MAHQSAFVFPGQGSQSLGMLAELSQVYPSIKDTFSEASEALQFDMWRLTQEGPVETLNQTENTQPLLLVASVALWRLWQSQSSHQPLFLAGHSLGEYSALVCSGAFKLTDAALWVRERGRLMQSAVPEGKGKMAAILGLDDEDVIGLCERVGVDVSAANFNAPGQVVIAGEARAVERACELAKEQGARKVMPLAVSVPSHCALMKPASEGMDGVLPHDFLQPDIPVLHNVDVETHSTASEIRQALLQQLYSPVRWSETVTALEAKGVSCFVECGPGRVLAGLNKRCARAIPTFGLETPDGLQRAIEEMEK